MDPFVVFLSSEPGLKFDMALAQNEPGSILYSLILFGNVSERFSIVIIKNQLMMNSLQLIIPPVLWNKFGNTAKNQ